MNSGPEDLGSNYHPGFDDDPPKCRMIPIKESTPKKEKKDESTKTDDKKSKMSLHS
jgi:hypothetical protein